MLKRLSRFVGSRFIDDLGVFFTEFNDILGGFRTRAEETFALLRQSRVGFVLVASPEPMAMREALFFHERLLAARMPFVGFVVNKVHPALPIAADVGAIASALAEHPGVAALNLSGTTRTMAAHALFAAHGFAGTSMVVATHVEVAYSHTGGMPVGIHQFCLSSRRATARIHPDGRVEFRSDPQWFTDYYRREGIE